MKVSLLILALATSIAVARPRPATSDVINLVSPIHKNDQDEASIKLEKFPLERRNVKTSSTTSAALVQVENISKLTPRGGWLTDVGEKLAQHGFADTAMMLHRMEAVSEATKQSKAAVGPKPPLALNKFDLGTLLNGDKRQKWLDSYSRSVADRKKWELDVKAGAAIRMIDYNRKLTKMTSLPKKDLAQAPSFKLQQMLEPQKEAPQTSQVPLSKKEIARELYRKQE